MTSTLNTIDDMTFDFVSSPATNIDLGSYFKFAWPIVKKKLKRRCRLCDAQGTISESRVCNPCVLDHQNRLRQGRLFIR